MIVPFAEDVMPAFQAAAEETPHRPVNLSEIARKIARAKGVPVRSERDPCSPSTLRALLGDLVRAGELVVKRGALWREQDGVTFLHQRDDGLYYATDGDVERWRALTAERRAAERLQQAGQHALDLLRDRHRGEYASIVRDVYLRMSQEAGVPLAPDVALDIAALL